MLRRYARSEEKDVKDLLVRMRHSLKKIGNCETVSEIMGYKGNAAKLYFEGLSRLVHEEFAFKGRSRRPPRDEFNSMLSLGYSILMNEIYGRLENKGLNPYFGFIHSDREKHPTLASDMMEEWRATLVDSLVMSLVNGHEIHTEHFFHNRDNPGYYLTTEGMNIFLKKYEKKMQTATQYLDYVDYAVTFRQAIDLQINELAKYLQGYGFRIQKSAFEAKISKRKYQKLLREMPNYVGDEDSVKVYKIIGSGQVTAFGKSIEIENEDIIVI